MRATACAVLAATIGLMVESGTADMTYAPMIFGTAMDASGNPLADGTYVMVADLDGDGWDGVDYDAQSGGADNATSWLWDADDMLMDRGQVTGGQVYPLRTIATADVPATWDPGVDEYYVLWFDVAYDVGATGPGSGVDYGVDLAGAVGTDPGNYGPILDGGLATLSTVGGATNGWYNDALLGDVDDSGVVTPLDALIVINKINDEGEHELSEPGDPLPGSGGYYWDVTNDATPAVSAADAQTVIDILNGAGAGGLGLARDDTGWVLTPEPATALLLVLGGGLLANRRRRSANA